MSIVIPEGFANATFVYSCSGTAHESTFSIGFKADEGPLPAPADLAEELYGIWLAESNPGQQDWLSTYWNLEACSVTYMTDTGPLVGEFVEHTNGTYVSAPMPINCAWLISKNTAAGGRKNRGRLYLPAGIYGAESEVNQVGEFSSATVTFMQAAWDHFRSDLSEADRIPVLFHSDGSAPTTITSFSANGMISTQRRRLR